MSDELLLRNLSEGCTKAFSVVFHRHWERVFGLAKAMLKSEHLAEEAVQEVFLRVWKNRQTLSGVKSIESYLFVAARNHVLNMLRSKSVQEELLMRYADFPADDGFKMERDLQQKVLLGLLDRAVNALPQQQKVAFRLSHQSGLGLNDIGIVMGISRNTVRNHLARALQSLRSQFKGLLDA